MQLNKCHSNTKLEARVNVLSQAVDDFLNILLIFFWKRLLFSIILVILIILPLLTSLLKSFEDSVKSRNFGQLAQRIYIWGIGDEMLNWKNGDEIDKEPRFQVPTGYFLSTVNHLFYFIIISTEERKDEVYEENQVY